MLLYKKFLIYIICATIMHKLYNINYDLTCTINLITLNNYLISDNVAQNNVNAMLTRNNS